jgi:hypothetical protein
MKTKTPWWFWLVAALAVLWNSGGVMDFTMTHSQNEAYLAAFSEEQREYFLSFPLWANIAWAFGVFGAFLGSLMLLFKRAWAYPLYLASIAGMFISFGYQFVSEAPADLYSGAALAFTIAIFVVAFLLLWFASSMLQKGLLT